MVVVDVLLLLVVVEPVLEALLVDDVDDFTVVLLADVDDIRVEALVVGVWLLLLPLLLLVLTAVVVEVRSVVVL